MIRKRAPTGKKVRYRGALGKRSAPVRPDSVVRPNGVGGYQIPIPDDEWQKFLSDNLDHNRRGLTLLFDHYEIAGDDIIEKLVFLVLKMGADHVPFFQTPTHVKRGTKVNHLEYTRLELDVLAAKLPGDRGDNPAIARLITRPRYKAYAKAGGVETLRKRLQRARKDPVVAFVRGIAEKIPKFDVGTDRKNLENLARVLGQVL